MAFTGSDWGRRVDLTIASDQIPSGEDYTGFVIWINHDYLPSEMIDADGSVAAKSDGGDIRIALDQVGDDELPIHVSRISLDNNPANSLVSIFTRVPIIQPGSDFVLYVFYDNSAANLRADNAQFGRDEVWQDYFAAYDFEQDPGGTAPELDDITGNGRDGTVTQGADPDNSVTRTEGNRLSGGRQWEFVTDGNIGAARDNHVILSGVNTDAIGLVPIVLTVVFTPVQFTGSANYDFACLSMQGQSSNGGILFGHDEDLLEYDYGPTDITNTPNFETVSTALNFGVARIIHMRRHWAFSVHEDGTELAPLIWIESEIGSNAIDHSIGCRIRNASANPRGGWGEMEFLSLRVTQYTDNRILMEYRNFGGVSDFIDVGTPGGTEINITITLTGLQTGTEVRVYEQGTTTEIDGVESSGTSFAFITGANNAVDIRIHHLNYEYQSILNFSSAADTSIPIQQQFDRNYENPP